ncbi:ATP-dependent DNA helicase PIF1 [Araneus ventricosus]|uniref:ATP-dependent DNA helicase n=1 Tax=Araneus ventricosus TaxID=182803 RepID=A0A4Y2IS08_ARAVE|nr:ATP-dependent DNA helicase PIF1 [Araneus ventricosus]
MKDLRSSDSYRNEEKLRDVEAKKILRRQDCYRESEKLRDRESKHNKRNVDLFRARENYYNLLRASDTNSNKLKLQFIKDRCFMADKICCCCEGLFFNHSVVKFNLESFCEKHSEEFSDKIFNFDSEFICATCSRHVNNGKVPKLATSNGIKFVDIPECLKVLSVLEERMVAPYINFMQLRPLKAYALNPQIGMKGSVVNIPIDIDDMVQVLPRAFDNLATIQIKLKRHVMHKSNYLFETVRPVAVCDALDYLVQTPLYREHNITIDKSYFKRYADQDIKNTVDFIVDEKDREYSEETSHLLDNVFIKDFLPENVNFDEDSDGEMEVDEEVMLIDRNKETVENVQVIAPGQGKLPVPWHAVTDIDELCFPKIYCGHKFKTPPKFSYADRVKFETRHRDRRACVPARLLFMAKKKLEMTCLSSINMCLRKTKATAGMKAKDALEKNYLYNLMKLDEGYKILKQIRSSPSYWETRKKELMATIRQLGKPTFFLTISAGETKWPELLKTLSDLLGSPITLEDANTLNDCEKTLLIKNDPVTCARYFNYKMSKLMSLLKEEGSLFGKNIVEDSYERVEFQQRGSRHEHIFLWLKNPPIYDSSNSDSIQACTDFIDQFITCEYKEDDPYVQLQMHRHSHACYKGKRNKQKCRFNFPMPVMPKTMILEPLGEDEDKEPERERLSAIRKQMVYYSKNKLDVAFEEMLTILNMTKENYIFAIRSSLKKPQVFLKRKSTEVNINGYNKDILHLFESNMDLQFVLEEYGIASYIIKYISKVDSGLSKILRDAASDAKKGYKSIKEKFRSIANVFLNSNLMSAQEAAYHLLSLPLSKCSRKVIYINTSPREERARMLKTNAELRCLNEDSTEVYMKDLFEKYSTRPGTLEDICLAQFVSEYVPIRSKMQFNEDSFNLEKLEYRRKKKSSVIRYRRYKLQQDRINYFREQVLLFLPWRSEYQEVEIVNCEEMYNECLDRIEENRRLFSAIADEVLEEALENAQQEVIEIEEEEAQDFIMEKVSQHQNVDILQQGGQEIAVNKTVNRYSCPKRISQENICSSISRLNEGQKDFVLHILNSFKLKSTPFYIFLSGSAGVGKSTVIKCVYQSVTNYFNSQPGSTGDHIYVLLCAPSGKAAFLIEGVTLHTAFALPVSQFGGQMPELSTEVTSTIRNKLFNTKLLIIDEISMVGSTLFSRVDSRLRQIKGVNKPFGGISVLVVGDLNQLPPVMDSPIFKMGKCSEFCELIEENPLWGLFLFYELKEIMRQKDEFEFIEALNSLASGNMKEKQIELIKSRELSASAVPRSAIRLYSENKCVDVYNEDKIRNHPGPEYISIAKDVILGKLAESTKERVLEGLKRKKLNEMNGLPHRLTLKIGIKYMITNNIDVEDGLVNGACGILKLITFENNKSHELKILWLDFSSENVGSKARRDHKRLIDSNNIMTNLVPIRKVCIALNISKKLQYQTLRTQFPIVPAEAITIHKSQGQTYQEVALDFNEIKKITRPLLYVALSRVSSISGLYIIGKFRVPKESKIEDPCLQQLCKLRRTKNLYMPLSVLKNSAGFKVAYQNVCSLTHKLQFIKSDKWYFYNDVLIFSETLTSRDENISLDGYKVKFRSDAFQGSRGLICLVKCNLEGLGDEIYHIIEKRNEYHVELFAFFINGMTIISGYKSPRTPINVFRTVFESIMNKVGDIKEIVVIGDFNFNIMNENNSDLDTFFNKFNLKSVLPYDIPTTDLNTQIDVIFANNKVYGGIYETYFSYHKPVYFICNYDIFYETTNITNFTTILDTCPSNKRRQEHQTIKENTKKQKLTDLNEIDVCHCRLLNTGNIIFTVPSNDINISPLDNSEYLVLFQESSKFSAISI